MDTEALFYAITEVKDELVDEAAGVKPAKKKVRWLKFGGIAAAVALVAGVGAGALSGNLPRPPGAASAGGAGHGENGSVFMSYAGPVFPMTTVDGGEGLAAVRALTYDFSPWIPVWWSNEDEAASRTGLTEEERQDVLRLYNGWYPEGGRYQSSTDLLVTDSYTLTNPAGEDRTVRLLYPFVGSLRDLGGRVPVLTAGGTELETTLHAGGYSGGFQGVTGNEDEALLNLEQLKSWYGYKVLLSDGRYQAQALEDFPDLSDTPVVVYKFTNAFSPEVTDRDAVPNPTIRAGFDLDYDKTTVLSYGFHGGRYDRGNGTMIQSFSIPEPDDRWYGEPYYLFVLGDDLQNLTTGGYVTGGTDPDTKPLDGCSVKVERYTTDLESALRETAELMYEKAQQMVNRAGGVDFKLYFGAMKEFLTSYGALSENGPERYGTGWIEDLDFENVDRVFYLEAEVTVPAGGSVTVSAQMTKNASFDFACAGTENKGIYGYDMVTKLGSDLDVTCQTAEAVNTECVEIVRQNYGFDWENGGNTVTLDPEEEHYFLEVRRAKTDG